MMDFRIVYVVVEKTVEIKVPKTDDLHKDLLAAHKKAYDVGGINSVIKEAIKKLKLEEGKYYRQVCGDVVGPIEIDEIKSYYDFPYRIKICNGSYIYYSEGGVRVYEPSRAKQNLVEEVENPNGLKLEVGKYYRQKDGNVVGPMCHDGGGDNWPFYQDVKNRADRRYFSVGGYRYQSHSPTPEDLVNEVPRPEPKYRAFASAEEFKPYREKWILRLNEEDGTSSAAYGAWRVDSYNEESVISDDIISYEELLEYRFEDGTPCGILTNP
jgi:hypothetical protein